MQEGPNIFDEFEKLLTAAQERVDDFQARLAKMPEGADCEWLRESLLQLVAALRASMTALQWPLDPEKVKVAENALAKFVTMLRVH